MTAPSPNEGAVVFFYVKMFGSVKKKCYIWSVTTGEPPQRIGRKNNVKNLHIWMTFIILTTLIDKNNKKLWHKRYIM